MVSDEIQLTSYQKRIFLSLINKHKGSLYNTSKMPVVVKMKNDAWLEIGSHMEQFGIKATPEQLKAAWYCSLNTEQEDTTIGIEELEINTEPLDDSVNVQDDMSLDEPNTSPPQPSGDVQNTNDNNQVIPDNIAKVINQENIEGIGVNVINPNESVAPATSACAVNTVFSSELASFNISEVNQERILQLKLALTNGMPFKQAVSQSNYSTARKMKLTEPYNLFYNTIAAVPEISNEVTTITFSDLLCPTLGKLKCSLQINHIIDISWLMEQYETHNVHKKPLTILYDYNVPYMDIYITECLPNVTFKVLQTKNQSTGKDGKKTSEYEHYSKIGIYVYKNGSLRVVITSANLRHEDWVHYNQGIWISPLCPPLQLETLDDQGESPTLFKQNLLEYLRSYDDPILDQWIVNVKRADFSKINVCLITSHPRRSTVAEVPCHGSKVRDLLLQHCGVSEGCSVSSWDINAQVSNLRCIGSQPAIWLLADFMSILTSARTQSSGASKTVKLYIIFPTQQNINDSHFGGGCLLPLKRRQYECQKQYLRNHLYEWSANATSRTKIIPNLTTYCRISPCRTQLAWFLLTTAPLSSKPWGTEENVEDYHLGIMFLPSFFGKEYLNISKTSKNRDAIFPFMYDTQLKKYPSDEE